MESAFALQENPSDSLFEELALAKRDVSAGPCPGPATSQRAGAERSWHLSPSR